MTNKKPAIIEATIERLVKEGRLFSTEDVAKDVGCSQSLIFRYYETKDALINACFDEVCHNIRSELDKVEFPENVNSVTVQNYMMDLWETYFNYLMNNRSQAKVYVACKFQGYGYPAGYDSPEAVMRRILSKHHCKLILKCPNAKLVAEYLILVANAAAIGLSSGWGDDIDNLSSMLKEMIMNGILSQCECGGHVPN